MSITQSSLPKVFARSLLAVFGAIVLLSSIPPQMASALDMSTNWKYTFADKATIYAVGTNGGGSAQQFAFVDPNPNDSIYQFFYTDACGANLITIPNLDPTADKNFFSAIYYANGEGCKQFAFDIDNNPGVVGGIFKNLPAAGTGTNPVPQAPNPYANSKFDWVDVATIAATGSKAGTFAKTGSVFENSGAPCSPKDNISGISADFTSATLTFSTNTNGPCYTQTVKITIGSVENQKLAAGASQPQCEDQGGLAWVICPVIQNIVDPTVSFLDNSVQSLLITNPSNFDNKELKGAWATIRNIALLILVPIMLVMVIGTAMEVGPFDAYTVRKAMPRMLAAVLFIVLSYSICTYAVEITNAMGTGILGLLTSAVGQDGPITLSSLFNGTGDTVGIFTALTAGGLAIGVAILAGALTFGIAFSFGFITILALFIGFLILVLRQVIILGLVLAAPIAILSWIFPGNDKMWNMWKTSFIRLLLMFPLIMMLIGIGRVFAYIINVK